MSHGELQDCFDLVPIRRPEDPCHYAFCLPNARAFARWPNFPAAARPEQGRAAAGRGIDAAHCEKSARGEALELASACDWGDTPHVTTSAQSLGASAILPGDLNGFSARQLAEREAWNSSVFGALDWRPAPCAPTRAIDWVAATDTTGAPCHVPADYVHVGRRSPGDADAVCLATTSGCATGPTLQEAKAGALLECVERDAIGRWWYGQTPKPRLDLNAMHLPAPLRHYLGTRPRHVTLLDLTTARIGLPVIAAASSAADGTGVALGFGADFAAGRAAVSAVVEMLQTEIGLDQRARQNDPLHDIWMRDMHLDRLPMADRASEPAAAPARTLAELVARLTTLGHRVAFIDLTRPEFGVPACRAVVPGFWSDKPRFAGLERAGHTDPDQVLPLLV